MSDLYRGTLGGDFPAGFTPGEPDANARTDRSTRAAWVQQQLDKAAEAGYDVCLLPSAALPYDASEVNFPSGVRPVRPGQHREGYDVQAFGAARDGVTDDAPAIQAALDQADDGPGHGTVIIDGPGVYKCEGQIRRDDLSNVEIVGQGWPTLNFRSMAFIGGQEGNLHFRRPLRLTIRGIRIRTADNITVVLEGPRQVSIRGNRIHEDASVENVACVDVLDDPDGTISTAADVEILNNWFRPADSGVLVQQNAANGRIIERLSICRNQFDGVNIGDVQGVIKLDAGVRDVVVSDNQIDGGESAQRGIAVTQDTRRCAVVGNTVVGCTADGIGCFSSQGDSPVQDVTIVANVVAGDNISHGITISRGTANFRNIVVAHNTIRSPTRMGIREVDGGTVGLLYLGNIIDGLAAGGASAIDVQGSPRIIANVTHNSGTDSMRIVAGAAPVLDGNDFDTGIAGDQRAEKINGTGQEAAGAGNSPTAAQWAPGDKVENTDDGTLWVLGQTGTWFQVA